MVCRCLARVPHSRAAPIANRCQNRSRDGFHSYFYQFILTEAEYRAQMPAPARSAQPILCERYGDTTIALDRRDMGLVIAPDDRLNSDTPMVLFGAQAARALYQFFSHPSVAALFRP
jgi:hypothetical protein